MRIHDIPRKSTEPPGFPLSHGDCVITPETMRWVMENCFYPPQKDRMKSGGIHIQRFVLIMRRGRWMSGSQITLARLPSGKHYAVNGYHRAYAHIEFGKPLPYNVQIIDCADENAVDALFSQFDRAIGTRFRPYEQGANALHFSERIGVSRLTAKAVFGAVLLIKNGMRPIKHGDRAALLVIEAMEDRIDIAMEWKAEAIALDKILYRSGTTLKRKLMGGPIFAVALVTMKYQPEKAKDFWSRVATNDGLRRGSPEHTLVQRLLVERMESHSEEPFFIPALAWNAFYGGRALGAIKSGSVKELRIAGTPVGKGGI